MKVNNILNQFKKIKKITIKSNKQKTKIKTN